MAFKEKSKQRNSLLHSDLIKFFPNESIWGRGGWNQDIGYWIFGYLDIIILDEGGKFNTQGLQVNYILKFLGGKGAGWGLNNMRALDRKITIHSFIDF